LWRLIFSFFAYSDFSFEHVPDAVDVLYGILSASFFEFFAEYAHVDFHCVRRGLRAVFPHVLQECQAAYDFIDVAGQKLQQVEFLFPHADRLSIVEYLARTRVDRETIREQSLFCVHSIGEDVWFIL
jgi:hypothetical protein